MSKEYRKYPKVEEAMNELSNIEQYTSIIDDELYDAKVTEKSMKALEQLKKQVSKVELLLKDPNLMETE